jgi:sulfoxide reductase heme-binding subunit YedZ
MESGAQRELAAPAARRPAAPATPPRRWLLPATVAAGLLPLAKAALDGGTHGLGANPIAEVLNRLGFWTLTLLTLSLVPTPAHDLLGLRWPVRVRRALGLLAFSYAALHFTWYLGVDRFFDVGEIARDVVKRKFVTIGFAALIVLVPLAITSTDRWVRRLGYARWKRLHRLAYVAALLGVLHFLWRVKADHRKPALFAIAIGALLLARGVAWARRRGRSRARRVPVRERAPRQQ